MELSTKLEKEFLIRWILDAFWRTLVHYGYWLKEVEYQYGMEVALEMEKEVGATSLAIQLKRVAKLLNIELQQGIPAVLYRMDENQLNELLDSLALNWLANDGVWFQTVEKKFGIFDAKRCNDTCWTRFSPYEAYHIKTLLDLPQQGGLDALKTALQFRLYARINKQDFVEEKSDSFVFRMIDCRVQASRRLKGLEDYPCKSIGIIEYRTFAATIDSRIQTECLGCPPDPPRPDWYCAWRFSIH
ncbi:MAG: cytosolic protein [Syntrophaceae bacterium]|nr:cytosolic protein [Syntrophaceae bacterium]